MDKKKSPKKLIIALIAIIVALAIAIMSVLIINKKKTSDENSDSNYVLLDSGFTDIKVTNEKTALEAINSVAPVLGLTDVNKELKSISKDKIDGDTYYKFQQYYNGIPVFGKTVTILAAKDGVAQTLVSNAKPLSADISKYNSTDYDNNVVIFDNQICTAQYIEHEDGTYIQFLDIKTGKTIGEICQTYTEDYAEPTEEGNVILFDSKRNIKGIDVHTKTTKTYFYGTGTDYTRVFYLGKELEESEARKKEYQAKKSEKTTLFQSGEANVFNNYFAENIDFITSKNKESLNKDAVATIKKVETTNDFFKDKLTRNGFDGHQSRLYIAYNDGIDNGKNSYSSIGNQLGFGYDEDVTIDLVAHEYMHSVEFTISHMNYKGESGALMEAYSDVFGELIEAYSNESDSDWIHKTYSSARNMISPNKNERPDSYQGKYWGSTIDKLNNKNETQNDHGSVHNNSTVFSHAAYLMWNGIGGDGFRKIDYDTLAKIWYRSLFLLTPDSNFSEAAKAIYQSAATLGTLTDEQLDCVKRAFVDVGIYECDYPTDYITGPGSELSVLDIDYSPLSSYYLEVRSNDSHSIVYESSVTSASPYKMDLSEGSYLFTIKENSKSKKEYKYNVQICEGAARRTLTLNTAIDASDNIIEYTPVASMTGWYGPEHFQWDFDYDYSSKTIDITKQYLEPTCDWGGGYPVDYAAQIDGLSWDSALNEYPLLAMTFNCAEGFNDDLLLAYHPKILSGQINKINVNGIGIVEYNYVDVETDTYYYNEEHTFKVDQGRLQEHIMSYKWSPELTPYKYTTKYSYDSEGRLTGYQKTTKYSDNSQIGNGKVIISYPASNKIIIDYSIDGMNRSWEASLNGTTVEKLHFIEEWQAGPEECDISLKYDSNGNLIYVNGSVGIYAGSGHEITYDSSNRITGYYPESDSPSGEKNEFYYKKKAPEIKHPSTTTTTTIKAQKLDGAALLKKMPRRYIFTSGAGAWRTYLEVSADGSFKGQYTDSEAAATGDGYPNGTVYISTFKGKFSKPVQKSDYTYSMKLEWLSVDGSDGDEYIKDNQKFIITDPPYGMENTDSFTIYVPGCPISSIPDELSLWYHYDDEAYLPSDTYFIYNPTEKLGFINTDEVYPILLTPGYN